MSALAVAAIGGYQRWLSPYKGFRCAHDGLHGRGGCSSFGRRAFERYPTLFAWQLLQRRFAECRLAAVALRSGDDRWERRRECAGDAAESGCSGACVALDFSDLFMACG